MLRHTCLNKQNSLITAANSNICQRILDNRAIYYSMRLDDNRESLGPASAERSLRENGRVVSDEPVDPCVEEAIGLIPRIDGPNVDIPSVVMRRSHQICLTEASVVEE